MATILERGGFEISFDHRGRPTVKAVGYRIQLAVEGEDVGAMLLQEARTTFLHGVKARVVDTSGSVLIPPGSDVKP